MKNIFILILITLSINCFGQLDRTKAPEAGPAPKIKIGNAKTFELKNGLKVIVVENHKLPVVSYTLSVDVDPILEKEAVGLVSIATDLLKAGTKNRTKEQIDEEIDFIGANLSTYATGIYGSSLVKHSDKLLTLMSDILMNPVFPEEELQKTLKQLKTGLQAQKTDPNAIASNLSSRFNYGENHPYGEVQTEESADQITREKCANYYQTYFKPNVSYLVIVGDIKAKDAKKAAQKYFGNWERGTVPENSYAKPSGPSDNKVILSNKDASTQSVFNVTFPVDLSIKSDDLIAANVMNSILGGGSFSGRLFQNLREKNAWTYGAYSNLSNDDLIGSFKAYSQVKGIATDSAVTEVLKEIKRLQTELVDDDHLELVKNSMSGSFARSLERPQTIARFALNTQKYNLPKDYYQTYLERLDKVNAQDVMNAAKKYLTVDKANIIAVGDISILKKSMAKFSPENKVLVVDIYGNEVKENENALPEGLTAEKVIENYINAVGGKSLISNFKTVQIKQQTGAMGMFIDQSISFKLPGKLLQIQSMGGQVLSKTIVNGDKARIESQRGNVDLTGPQLEMIKLQTNIVPELYYSENKYQLNLLGAETIDGIKAYKMEVTNPLGIKVIEYFNSENGLKIRSAVSQGQMTIVTNYKEYMEQDGFKFPKVYEQSAGPQTMTTTTIELIIDEEVSDSTFEL